MRENTWVLTLVIYTAYEDILSQENFHDEIHHVLAETLSPQRKT